MKPAQTQKGFTLIELLIVISLVTIITGAIIPSFNTYVDNQYVRQAQETIIDDLRNIQNKALNGELAQTELGCPGACTQVQFWGIRFTADSPTYQYFISTNDLIADCTSNDPDVFQLVNTSLPLPGESITRMGSTRCVWVSFENGDITADMLTNNTITVGQTTGANTCGRIVVSANGLIQEGAGNACAP